MFLILAIAGSSCKKNYLDLVANPNVPSAASPNLLLSGALKTSAGIVNGSTGITNYSGVAYSYVMYANWGGYMSQSTGYQPFVALEQYQFTTSSYDVWTAPYLNLSNYQTLQSSTTEPYYVAIAKIMSAYIYEGLVDNYNNVPYSNGLKGTANVNPAYDNGSAIYDDLLKQLDAAITMIKGAPATALNPTSADVMFGGNMTSWVKFANTLKLRLALRQTNVTAKTAALKAAVAATESEGYLDGTLAATVNPGYTNSDANGGQQSPLWLLYGLTQSGTSQAGNAQYQANSFLADFFGGNKDPRLIRVYSGSATAGAATATNLLPGASLNTYPDATGNVVAVVSTTFGDSQPPTGTVLGTPNKGITPSKVGPGILKSASMPAVIMSSAEALFLQAEAAKDGYITGDDQALYNAAITASFVDLNAQVVTLNGTNPPTVLAPEASAAVFYGAGGAYAYPAGGTDAQKETAIITQKWAALAITGSLEGFNEIRRTGIPNVPTSIYPGANAPNQITRIFYPFIEYSTNAANVGAQGTIDKFTSKIFWAK